ncbi:hypothetical protein EUGRSUZ_L02579 [Eucalyptus grandis]|uniref:Uncharacterized protein n=1 Tax=Eucalyptus grandis TaxID=71139 RepID=A0AAD9T8V3_EUCGR|nr:hypothetical protein EUGRSUZ_L02579 [Eucalyptus grandis]
MEESSEKQTRDFKFFPEILSFDQARTSGCRDLTKSLRRKFLPLLSMRMIRTLLEAFKRVKIRHAFREGNRLCR